MNKPNIIELDLTVRQTGTEASQQLRDEEMIPAVIYGPGIDGNINTAIPELTVEKLLSVIQKEIVRVKIEGKTYDCTFKNCDFHPVTDRPLHVDLYAMNPKKPVTITVPIRLEGTAPGVTEGGRVFQPLRELQLKCLPEHIPAEAVINIGKMQIGSALKIRRVKLPNVEIITPGTRTVVVVRPPKGVTTTVTELEDDEELEEGAEGAEGEAVAEGEAAESKE